MPPQLPGFVAPPVSTHRIRQVRLVPCVQRQEDPTWRFAGGAIAEVPGWRVELTTDQGALGHGYIEVIPVVSTTPAGARAAFEALAPLLLGADPFRVEWLLQEMDRALPGRLHVKAGIDGALHDLIANIVGQPLHRLFGGAVHERVVATRILPLKSPEAMAADGARLVAKGYGYLKIKLSGDAPQDIARVRAIRDRVGSAIRLSVDPNQAYRAEDAIPALRKIAQDGVDLVEQPVPAADLAGLKAVRDALDMVVEADESITSLRVLLELIGMRALDSANLKIGDLGGLRNTAIAARICDAAGIGYRIGATFGPRLMAAQAVHLAVTFPNQDYAQEVAEFDHLLDDPFAGLDVAADGTLAPPPGAGSGVHLHPDAPAPANAGDEFLIALH
jgi:L-alanine-DL-glutamate epimerase-like enolase superfamily enzyme